MTDIEVRTEALTKLDLQPGDILHVKVGGDLGTGDTWIPTQQDLQFMYQAYEPLVPQGTWVIVTNHLVEDSAIQNVSVTHWPPKIKHVP